MFDDDTLYLAGDPASLELGRPSTLAHWRSEGRGPAFIELGSLDIARCQPPLGPQWVDGRSHYSTDRWPVSRDLTNPPYGAL